MGVETFPDLAALATHIRAVLDGSADEPERAKRFVLLYAHNGVGKTRLSMAFKDLGRNGDARDTLYYNAYTEDLFHWDNDLDGDSDRKLVLNTRSRFFAGLGELEMDTRIRPLLQRYVDFDFQIDTDRWVVRFYRPEQPDQPIKISRGEESLFIWCFFLAIMQLALDGAEAYQWVKYIYIDDPISSLDEQNAITLANHLGQFLRHKNRAIKVLVSTHHALFFNVVWNETRKLDKKADTATGEGRRRAVYQLAHVRASGGFTLTDIGEKPFFHHLALLEELCRLRGSDEIYAHHFNELRSLLEKAAAFHGYNNFSVCIRKDAADDPDATLYARVLNIMSHGNYPFYSPVRLQPENREHFEKVVDDFLAFYHFNTAGLPGEDG